MATVSSIFLQISPHSTPNFKPLLFSLILSSSLIKTESVAVAVAVAVALSGCSHGNCSESSIPYSVAMLVVLAPVLASTWIVWTQQRKKMEPHRISLFDRNGGNVLKKKLSKRKRSNRSNLKIYTAREMKIATNNYSDTAVMQRCNPGDFYRGTFENTEEVVVMKIPTTVPTSKIEEFIDEVIFLSLPHTNVVKLLGCCLETSFPLLVYELHGDGNTTLSDEIAPFSSSRENENRAKIVAAAAAAARGLAYLQSRNPRAGAAFCHGGFHCGNILLDDSFDHAKLFYAMSSSFLIDRDPEKSDVYSFGVMLVELLSCQTAKRLCENDVNPDTWLASFVERGGGEVTWSEEDGELVKVVADMARRCLSVRSEERPSVKELEARLSGLVRTLH